MGNIFIVIGTVIFLVLVFYLYFLFQDKIHFFAIGLDNNFKFREISVLWTLAKETKLKNPLDLYDSMQILNKSISTLIENAKTKGTYKTRKFQSFLEKLYKYRTRLALDHENKRGLESSKFLDKGQRLRIILKGSGIFYSKIVDNEHELIVSMPRQYNKQAKRYVSLLPEKWENQEINVYLWRKNDACYAFDTKVLKAGFFLGTEVLFLRQSYNLQRIQKRQSIRTACQIYAQLYLIKSKNVDYKAVETEQGYRCLIEDISQDGAMIRIGGKGENNINLKLQFLIDDTMIVMFGIVRAVEYNANLNQSRLHFECTHIDSAMQNKILSFVYNIIPNEQKDLVQVMNEIEKESKEDSKSDDSNSQKSDANFENPQKNPQDLKNTDDSKTSELKNADDEELSSDKKIVYPNGEVLINGLTPPKDLKLE